MLTYPMPKAFDLHRVLSGSADATPSRMTTAAPPASAIRPDATAKAGALQLSSGSSAPAMMSPGLVIVLRCRVSDVNYHDHNE